MTKQDDDGNIAGNLLSEILTSRCVVTSDGRSLPLHSELPAEEGGVLQHWLCESSATRLLEIGCAYGISSLYICEAISDRDIECYHVIDAYQQQQWCDVGRRHLQLAGPTERISFHESLSEQCLPALLTEDLHFNFVYVDGWHTFDQVMLEFFYINRMLEVGGIVVFDDVHLPSIQKVLACINTYPGYEQVPAPPEVNQTLRSRVRRAAGVPPIRLQAFRKIEEDVRNWDWFVQF
ncbi:MAG: putative O-methyltransferase YrrM [Halioglobus sp.]|jgi:predicted O-methyltransferase YrrM